MLNILSYIPETILLITTLICSLFLIKKTTSHKSTRVLNILFTTGIIICAASLVQEVMVHPQDLIKNIFKFYFLLAATYYMFTYSKRFHAIECLCLLSTCIGLFMIISTTDSFILLSAFALCIISAYGLALTREHPSKDTAMLTSLLLIICILYGIHPFMASMVLLLATTFFYLRTTNRDIEAFCVTLLIPINVYILLRQLMTATDPLQIERSLIAVGILLMLSSPILLLAESNKTKNMAKFAIFYVGTVIFLMGSGTLDIKASAIIMTLFLVFIYSPIANPLAIIGLAMLPPATTFIIKLPLFWAPFKSAAITQIVLISVATLAMSIFAAKELYRFHTSNKGKLIPFPVPFKIISIAVIIISVIYFSYINQTLEYAIRALGK